MVGMAAKGEISSFVSIPISTLLVHFRNQKYLIAKNGQSGAGNKKTGQDAEDLIVMVPKGTVIFDSMSNQLIYDCCDEGIDYLVLKGVMEELEILDLNLALIRRPGAIQPAGLETNFLLGLSYVPWQMLVWSDSPMPGNLLF